MNIDPECGLLGRYHNKRIRGCMCERGRRRGAASCLFIRNIRWEMRAWEKSKEQGMCLFHFLKSMHVGDLTLLQDTDGHEYGQRFAALLMLLLWIFEFLICTCSEIEERPGKGREGKEEGVWGVITVAIMYLEGIWWRRKWKKEWWGSGRIWSVYISSVLVEGARPRVSLVPP